MTMSTVERAQRANARGTILCWAAVPLLFGVVMIAIGLDELAPVTLAPGIAGFVLGIAHMAWADGYEAGRRPENRDRGGVSSTLAVIAWFVVATVGIIALAAYVSGAMPG